MAWERWILWLLLHIELTISFPIGQMLGEFLKSVPVMPSSCRLYNSHFKDTQSQGLSCRVQYDRGL